MSTVDKSLEISNHFDEYEEKSHQRRKYMDGLKRYLEDLKHSSDEIPEEGPTPAKKAKISEPISIFQHLFENPEPHTHHGQWKLVNENENSATFGFAQGT